MQEKQHNQTKLVELKVQKMDSHLFHQHQYQLWLKHTNLKYLTQEAILRFQRNKIRLLLQGNHLGTLKDNWIKLEY